MTKKYTLQINHGQCMGCSTCVSLSPDIFEINPDDGQVALKNFKQEGDYWIGEVEQNQIDDFEKAIQACPLEIIIIKKSR